MAGIKQAREDFESEKTYLSNEELIQTQTEFCVLGEPTLETGGQFGPVWTLAIVYLDDTGEHTVQNLYLSAGSRRNGVYKENAYRRWFFTKKAVYPIHHVILTQGIAQNGMKFNDLADAEGGIDPCPCMTGDWVASAIYEVLQQKTLSEVEVVDGPISDIERENFMEGIYKLSTTMGWPTDKESLDKKTSHELKMLYKNLGALAAKQTVNR